MVHDKAFPLINFSEPAKSSQGKGKAQTILHTHRFYIKQIPKI